MDRKTAPPSHSRRNARGLCAIAFSFVAMLLALCAAAGAQLAGKGAISGTVQDTTGAVVPGATVEVKSQTRGITVTQQSTGAGAFNFNTLDPDKYTVTVTMQGFEKLVQQNVTVNALEVSDVPVKLTVGGGDQSITVTDAPPAVETSNSTLGGTLEQQTYSELPIQQGAYGQDGARRATDFVALLPGVQFNETNGNATTNTGVVNGGGARGAVSDTYIDGLPFISAAGQGDPRFVWSAISVDAVNQLQVQTSGYSAMYEGQGVQNYQVKQGSNAFHGSAYEFFRNTALDSYQYFSKLPNALGVVSKPAEHQNEFGGFLGGPIKKDKLFFFGNYNKYNNTRGPQPTYQTNPTTAEMQGNFQGITQTINGVATQVNIYDPTSCPTGNTGNCQRTAFTNNQIPGTMISPQAQFLQKFLPPLTNQNQVNNYLGGFKTGLSNFTATGTLNYVISPRQTVNILFGIGKQQTTSQARPNFAASGTAAFNQSPAPYVYTQQFNPATKVAILEHTFTITPKQVNQFKYGFARYEGSTFSPGYAPQYSAASAGINGLPPGQTSGAFPFVRFTGPAAPNNWANVTDSHQSTNAFTLVDNYNIAAGAHSVTMGVQIAWLQYNFLPQSGGSTPLTLNFATGQTGCYAQQTGSTVSTTACYTGAAGTTSSSTVLSTTGIPYASFLLGAVSSASFTSTTVPETGARFRPISPYVQDDWKVTPKLTVNIGLRWDYYPPFREVLNRLSYLDTNATNPITGTKGALAFAGSGNGPYCNCSTNVQSWYKNFGPRLGLAYAVTPTTVIRSSYGVVFAHGNGTGGSAISRQGTGLLGFAASPSYSSAGQGLPAFYLNTNIGALSNSSVPAYTPPPFLSAGYGTGYYTGGPSPQTVSYGDPYYGDRAPEFINWSFGIQQQYTQNVTLTANYVGSQGHFLQPDSQNARGVFVNQLDTRFLSLGNALQNKATPANLAAVGLSLPYTNYDQSQTIAKALAPFPQYNSISDSYGAVANSNYHALQLSFAKRTSNGSSFMLNYTWAKNIDDAGTFRTGYDIPASVSTDGRFYRMDRIERSLSLADRRHNVVFSGVYASPFGRTLFANNKYVKAIFGGFRASTIFQAFTGSPLAITGQSCGTNPSQNTCMPVINPNYTGSTARIRGNYGAGMTAVSAPSTTYLDPAAFQLQSTAYKISALARTSPFGLRGPGNYNLDIGLRRSFSVPGYERLKLTLDGEMFNATNHTWFSNPNTVFGNAAFGTVTGIQNLPRDAQLAARIDF